MNADHTTFHDYHASGYVLTDAQRRAAFGAWWALTNHHASGARLVGYMGAQHGPARRVLALRAAFRFHHEHGGWCDPPGRAACALRAARAEHALAAAIDAGTARVRWEHDDTAPDPGDIPNDEYAGYVERFGHMGCIIETRCDACGSWEHAASLWGIVGDDDYRRVVEAELADEAGIGGAS